jgi:TRAP-type mannitol/chloroaromatic compound transport system substrate-binding protein
MLTGKSALIAGSTQGIGLAMRLAAEAASAPARPFQSTAVGARRNLFANKLEETTMAVSRRQFLPAAAATVAASTLAAPAIAQGEPTIKWRLTSSFPKSLDTLFGAATTIARLTAEMTDNKFQLQAFAAGEIVPALQVLDAVSNNTVECGHTYTGYYIGKNPTLIFDGSVPFGLTPRMHNAWMMFGEGRKLMDEIYDSFGVVSMPAGQTGGQMFGWFRKELKSPKDFEGLKMRTAGFGGKVMAKLGAIPQQIAGGEIYPSLERGTIDACEWVGPYDDEKLGFNKVAKYYYYPGWWEGASVGSLYINNDAWAKLPKQYQAMVETAAGLVTSWMVPKYDAGNPAALRRLVAAGTELRPFPRAVLEPCFAEAYKFYDELAAKDPKFKKIYDSLKAFRADQNLWFRVAENTFDNFNFSMSAQGR